MGWMYFPGEKVSLEGYVINYRSTIEGMNCIYTGFYKNGRRNGNGKIAIECSEDGIKAKADFNGEWKNDEPYNGILHVNRSNGDFYNCRYKDGEEFGRIEYRKTDEKGNVSEGFEDAKTSNGRGEIRYKDGRIYEGEMYNEDAHGKGILKYPYSDQYERLSYDGNFRYGDRHGKGKLTWRSGSIYIGDFERDYMNGSGRLKLGNGAELYNSSGSWIKGKKEGRFIYKSSTGEIFLRTYRDNKQI